MLLRHTLLPWGIVLASACWGQHTPLTSQYLFNGLLINPAYAGSRDALAANLTHRQQWAGFEGAPVTQVLSVHSPVAERKVGLGLVLYNDRIGVSRETGVLTNYAYRLKMPKGRLAFGLGAGFTRQSADWHQVALQDRNDATFAEPLRGAIRPNFSMGVYYYADNWFAGASAPFLLMHRHGSTGSGDPIGASTRATMQPMLFAGRLFTLSPDLKLKPTTLVRYRAESGPQADLSLNAILREKLWIGASYRSGDAVIGMIEVLPSPQWRFGYSYDMGTSSLRRYHAGSHELMVQYELGYRIRARDPRYF